MLQFVRSSITERNFVFCSQIMTKYINATFSLNDSSGNVIERSVIVPSAQRTFIFLFPSTSRNPLLEWRIEDTAARMNVTVSTGKTFIAPPQRNCCYTAVDWQVRTKSRQECSSASNRRERKKQTFFVHPYGYSLHKSRLISVYKCQKGSVVEENARGYGRSPL